MKQDRMGISLRPVTRANRGDLDAIDAGAVQRFWVHSPWYWHQQSLDNPAILFRLIHLEDVDSAIGMVAFGPAYADEELSHLIAGSYEIIHVVIDTHYQRRGIGQVVARAVLHMLAAHPDCQRILVAHHPENLASRSLFLRLGFQPTELRNYDGDPILELQASAITQQP